MTDTTATPRRKASLAAVIAMPFLLVLMSLVAAPAAQGAFGDSFGLSPLNDGAGPLQEAPTIPDTDDPVTADNDPDAAFWAGTCDRASAPALGAPITDGIGNYSPTIPSPDSDSGTGVPTYGTVAAPSKPPHCVDWGLMSVTSSSPWAQPPSWRLAAHTQAGGHPDASTNFAFNRNASGNIDGSLDNIVVDLPPGFIGDPNAVAKCTAEEFAGQPLRCPPQSQVGVLHLEIQAVFGAANVPGGRNERIYPLYNLEPRQGNVAELGFGYASGEDAIAVRIVAKARTNSDYGVNFFVGQIPAALQVRSQQVTVWGVPWEASNDRWRGPANLRPGGSGCNTQPGASASYYIPPAGFDVEPPILAAHVGCAQKYDPSWGPIKPFISNLTECTGAGLTTRIALDAFQHPGPYTSEHDPRIFPYPQFENENKPLGSAENPTTWKTYSSPAPPMQRCNAVPFDTDIDLKPTSQGADAASGLSVDLDIPQNNEPPLVKPAVGASPSEVDNYVAAATAHWKSDAGLATSQLDKAVVTLPEGFSLNPSAASGLDGCSDTEFGVREQGNPPLFNNGDPFDGVGPVECPQESIIGEVSVHTPLLDNPLNGQVVLGDPKSTDPTSGEMFRTFIVVKDDERGLIAKIYGSAVADPNTGKLTATFDNNPKVPFETMHIEFKRGDRGILATPQRCTTHGWASTFTPWTAAHGAGGQDVPDNGAMTTDQNCGFGFAPSLKAGMNSQQAGGSGTFAFQFDRPEGQQWVRGLSAELPTGLLASVKDVPLCSDAAANAGTCGPESRIGFVDAGAGSGNPYFLEKKGDVYLTEGYRGAPYGLSVRVPVEAGPFKGDFALTPIVVRQALYVDTTDAHATAVSDPFPLVHHGIPLRVRQATVVVDRAGFMRNPTNCAEKQIKATFTSAQGTQSSTGQRFQTAGCAGLGFQPKLTLALTGKKQTVTGKHPGVKAVVTQAAGEAGVGKAEVRLPRSLALDPDNAQALCDFVPGTQPDVDKRCPAGSIVGRARAESPLLRRPLTGNVYFVKNVRTDPRTGNAIRTLPMIVVALRGEISVNLRGESDTTDDGRLVNTFNNVPDAPIKQFNLNIAGGKNGILAVTRTRAKRLNICQGKHVAEVDFDGQNGKRFDRDVRMKAPCKSKKATKKKAAKKKAAKRKGAKKGKS